MDLSSILSPQEISLQSTNINFITHSLALSISQRKVTTAVQFFPCQIPSSQCPGKATKSNSSGWIAQTRCLRTDSPDVERNCLDSAIPEKKNKLISLVACIPDVLLRFHRYQWMYYWHWSCYEKRTVIRQKQGHGNTFRLSLFLHLLLSHAAAKGKLGIVEFMCTFKNQVFISIRILWFESCSFYLVAC